MFECVGENGTQDLEKDPGWLTTDIDYIDVRGEPLDILMAHYEHWPYPIPTKRGIKIFGSDAKAIAWWWFTSRMWERLGGG